MHLEDFQFALQEWVDDRPYRSLTALIPSFEYALRRAVVCLNFPALPLSALTAESTVLYTTIDSLLAQHLPTPNSLVRENDDKDNDEDSDKDQEPQGSRNVLWDVLGQGIMSLLRDMFVERSGVRLRDRIAHGEIPQSSLPSEFARLLLVITGDVAAHFSQRQTDLFRNYRSSFGLAWRVARSMAPLPVVKLEERSRTRFQYLHVTPSLRVAPILYPIQPESPGQGLG